MPTWMELTINSISFRFRGSPLSPLPLTSRCTFPISYDYGVSSIGIDDYCTVAAMDGSGECAVRIDYSCGALIYGYRMSPVRVDYS